MAIKKKQQIETVTGMQALQAFMKEHGGLFNLTEMERQCGLNNGKLRHISAGSRVIEPDTYNSVQEVVLPKMCQLVFILQNYGNQVEIYSL